ncbi:hypothetical protein PGUG_00600 [Meyerozyma guilliermondii ATCC 6260]|uniref:sphinganine-1-phosphate aldolase n=1 Tax=Meyerozyma guilliermondii (strain ATCC 6260 / CBS 566 / DSM 6381 / JCM 1539 / NBRC 10279 / NRRL Y-324) TaxID=294746 RepID=A5DBE5_PICGU|nr:uncharacterized protein PGUG_00600 [Meyerozyma guilliermondii ATCC 6260]EDK36502.2 hypothetical protein PGUG_00600 [Meyerozyma guilliermondii ATCC 6260]
MLKNLDVQLLSNHYYGVPYLPHDFQSFVFLVQIYFWRTVKQTETWYFGEHSSPLLGYLMIARDVFLIYVFFIRIRKAFRVWWGYGTFKLISMARDKVFKVVSSWVLSLPPIKKKVDTELKSTIELIEDTVIKGKDLDQHITLPEIGYSGAKVESELDSLQAIKHSDWANGRVSGAVYHGGDELLKLQTAAYEKYSIANQLHPDVFPGVRKMEAEIVSMVLKLFNAPASGCGSTTSGGTESLLLTGLAAREYGKRKKGISEPEVIAPMTVHAGIEKACNYFGMKLHKVEVNPVTYQVDVKSVKRHINNNTVLIVGSAPNYPHGVIDDIEALSELALKYNIPLHVDACLGSFIVTFLEKSKVHGTKSIPLFDFRLAGVTSISCDTHKYGFAPKGSSVIMYRTPELRQCQYYVSVEWAGGMYGSPTLAGSRPGALAVGCWATLMHIGEKGYRESCFDIVTATMKLKEEIKSGKLSQYLEVLGDPIASVIAFKSKNASVNIYDLGDALTAKGWHFAALQKPAALHFAFTRLTVPIVNELIRDLIECTEELAANKSGNKKNDTAAIYGVAGSVSTSGVANRIIVAFLDALYKV